MGHQPKPIEGVYRHAYVRYTALLGSGQIRLEGLVGMHHVSNHHGREGQCQVGHHLGLMP